MFIKNYYLNIDYNMFKASASGTYVPSKSQSVKPDVVSDVSPLEQIRLLIPSFVGFVDPQESYMKLAVNLSGVRGQPVPDPVAGVHAFFRNWICRDGGNSATLETLEDYNAMVGSLNPFTEQSTITHLRELFAGVQETENRDGTSLYYGAPASLAGTTQTAPSTTRRVTTTPQIQFRPMLGCMSNQVVPVSLLNGMRMSIDTEDPSRALRYLTNDGSKDADTPVTVAQAKLASADDRTGVAGFDTNFFEIDTDIVTDNTGKGNPFSIDDILYTSKPDGSVEQKLGVVIGFRSSNAGTALLPVYVPQRDVGTGLLSAVDIGDLVYYKFADRVIAFNNLLGQADLGAIGTGTLNIPAPSYTLSGIEYLAQSVNPPDDYVEGMMKKAMTSEGVSLDYLSCDLFRHNQSNIEGIVQAQIPTLATRGKSIICQPLPVAWYRDMSQSSLSGIPDGARNYQFIFGSNLIPSRPAELGRYSQTLPRNEPLHTSEIQKALININKTVFNLQKIDEHFVIARGFNKYGQITNFSEATMSLRVDYGASASQVKIFNNFVWSLRRLTISKGMVSVMN
tara:strand:- start:993 stop:2687 length:1695 start_codon:yes stop_codon:yes gene_type:complete